MKVLGTDEESLREAAKIIKKGGLVAFPTETVYGLGCDGLNEKAVKRLFEVKKRPANKPVTLHVSSISQIKKVAEINDVAKKLIDLFFPGPLTIILKKKDVVPPITAGGSDRVAVRMPACDVALKLIDLSGILAAPSANKSGGISPTSAKEVAEEFGSEIDAIIDGGETKIGIESTILDLTVKPAKILRTGAISVEEIESVVGEVEVVERKGHYRMKAEVVIAEPEEILKIAKVEVLKGKKVGMCVSNKLSIPEELTKKVEVVTFRDVKDYSKKLFYAMRKLGNLDTVIFQKVEEKGVGKAIMDRLRESSSV